jgi:filamentous hemagglutinin family protein
MKNIENVQNLPGFMPRKMAKNFARRPGFHAVLAGVLMGASLGEANPSGGSVAAGSATISGTGTPSVTINQLSNTAIINWNAFSIGSGEVTTFVQPSAASAVLNRVTGGGMTSIDGTLNANGQVFIINGNGVYIGKSGAVNTSGFAASTLDISDADFEKNNLKFSGTSSASVQNFGTINASTGDIYLIGQSVDNEGALNAANGTVGLAAAQSVLIKQSGTQHVFVSSTTGTTPAAGTAGVTNRGSIAATAAELRAANGNMYALAINNGGTIRATTVQNQGGHIYLTSDSGVIVNTGTVDASATAAGGKGGTIQFQTSKTDGTVVNHGSVISHGGQGGTGGDVDLSGGTLDFTGGVNLTSPGGKTGSLLLDPQSIDIINDPNANGVVTTPGTGTTTGTTTIYTPAPNFTNSELYTQTLDAQLLIANVVVDGISNVTVTDPIAWGDATASTSGKEFANSLTLETTGKGGTIVIDASITAHETVITGTTTPTGTSTLPKAGLIINDEGNGYVTTGVNGAIDVDNFTLENGFWQQILTPTAPTAAQLKVTPGLINSMNNTVALPGFNVTNDFQLDGTTTFERFAGGDGINPTARTPNNSAYQIVDIYGLQGIGSPSDTLLGKSFVLDNDLIGDTTEWNGGDGVDGGAGFLPIGEGGKTVKPFTGTLDGNGFEVDGIYLNRPNDNLSGLFGEVSGTVDNLTVASLGGTQEGISAILAGEVLAHGVVNECFTTQDGDFAPTTPSDGTTANQSQLLSLGNISIAGGGLVGEVLKGGVVENSGTDASYVLLGSGGVSGLAGLGGLIGINYGTVTNCYSLGSYDTINSVQGTSSGTAISESINIGGLVGLNYGTINGGQSTGVLTPNETSGTFTPPANAGGIVSGTGNFNIGGFVGANFGTIDSTVKVAGQTVSYQAFTNEDIAVASGTTTGPDVYGGTGSYNVGGFVGLNAGKISNAYAAPTIGGVYDSHGDGITSGSGGVISVSNNLQPSGANGAGGTGALGDITVGGFAGTNTGSILHSGTEDVVVSGANIQGVGTVNKKTSTGTVTVPEPISFSNPLEMNSIFVGGFVGLNGPHSVIQSSFSDDNGALSIALTLDPTQPTPTLAAPGSELALQSDGPNIVTVTGNITGGAGYYITGGFAGGNYGSITTSYSNGAVNVAGTTSQSNSFYTGGFAGVSSGVIANVYETGDVTSATSNASPPNNQTGVVGGLVAQMNGGSVSYAYETGSVSGGTTRGGLVAVRALGTISRSFWDTDNNTGTGFPNGYSAGGTAVGTLENTTLDIDTATEPTSIYAAALWNFKTIWVTPASSGLPTLLNVP